MTLRKLLAVVLAPLVVALTGAFAPGPGEPALPGWPGRSICATAFFSLGPPPWFLPDGNTVQPGLQACPGEDPQLIALTRWAVVPYRPGVTPSIGSMSFLTVGADGWAIIPGPGWEFAPGSLTEPLVLCVLTGPDERAGCARVRTDGAVTVEPVPVDDPLVDRPVEVYWEQDGDPACGACV
ncbi:hypothetical protein [Catenuloplanes indicus]|uniref:Secreted protein n=1 Tax=Catenuloplanes indicus TaxID=137267 RepID=A0AAE3VUU5_9ACTN|nr:hypothetical protein [Catenuloplanes indicus]MDQ0363749.1 hypothetical protein [Catenuloplanes indicus]